VWTTRQLVNMRENRASRRTVRPSNGAMKIGGWFASIAVAASAVCASTMPAAAYLTLAAPAGAPAVAAVANRSVNRPTPAVSASTRETVHRRHVHRRRHHIVTQHHDLIAHRPSSHGSGLPLPTHSHAPQQPAVPNSHTHLSRTHDAHPKSSPRHSATGAWIAPTQLAPLGSAPGMEFVTLHRVDLWRNEGRGPPRLACSDALPSFARRPSTLTFPGARPASFYNSSNSNSIRSRGGCDLFAHGRSARKRATFVGDGVSRAAASSCNEAPHELRRVPVEGPAREVVPSPSFGGCS